MTQQLLNIRHQPFDYQALKDLLSDYNYPRNKISRLIGQGEIIALKSGLYVLSELFGRSPAPELVANLLYGPSYVSLDYALARYGLIPEQVFAVTSVCTGRKKQFDTAIGSFSYQQVKASYYSLAYLRQETDDASYLIATPEKALCDKLYLAGRLPDLKALEILLYEDLRIDESGLAELNIKLIHPLAKASGSQNLRLLMELLS